MMDPARAGNDGRRRNSNRKNRGRNQRRKRSQRPRGGRGHHRGQLKELYTPVGGGDDTSILGRRNPAPRDRRPREKERLDPFTLFCAYHLGITPDDGYHEPRPDEVARRFGITREELFAKLRDFRIDNESIAATGFDMEGAKLDIRLAPEGISRTETARTLFEQYRESLQDRR